MEKVNVMEFGYVQEIVSLVRNEAMSENLAGKLERYHENDIAEALELLTSD